METGKQGDSRDRGDVKTRKQGDKATGRKRDRETGRQGDREAGRRKLVNQCIKDILCYLFNVLLPFLIALFGYFQVIFWGGAVFSYL